MRHTESSDPEDVILEANRLLRMGGIFGLKTIWR
jgi:hypothetical protein